MWTQLMKSFFALGIFLIAVQSFAATQLSLEDLRHEVLSENLDVKIQYEKYYQSQKNVSAALGEFLPSASISLINVNATMALLQSLVPIPSDWFVYESSKELKVAEKYTTESIKLNILEGLSSNYLNLKYQEAIMVSLKKHEAFLEDIYNDMKKKQELGLATDSDVFLAKRNLMQHRQDIFALNTLMITEKQALLIAINRAPTEELELGPIPSDNLDVIPANIEDATKKALKNAPELVSNTYQAEAARNMVASKRWSFISFNGIGFDYGAKLAIEKSKARIIALQRDQIALKIKNQVYSAYNELAILDQRIEVQKQVLEEMEKIVARNEELFHNDAIPLSKYTEGINAMNGEERTMIKIEMDRKLKIVQLKRLLGLDTSLNDEDTDYASKMSLKTSENEDRRGQHEVHMKIDADKDVLSKIFSVTYSIEGLMNSGRTLNSAAAFGYVLTTAMKGTYTVKATIMLVSGDTITKEEVVVVD